jgi:hypothetical protein
MTIDIVSLMDSITQMEEAIKNSKSYEKTYADGIVCGLLMVKTILAIEMDKQDREQGAIHDSK